MRAIALTAVALLLCTLASAKMESVAEFEAFKAKFGRSYSSPVEEAHRFKIFNENMAKARAQMKLNPHATFGVNEFADVSASEFKSHHNAEKAYKKLSKMAKKLDTLEISEAQRVAAQGSSADWRPKGAVTAVKNQGDCGSCWSFSTTGGIEGQWFLAGNTLTSLSEQELVSCDTIDDGCNGGLMDNAFTWLLQANNGSIVTEASYPYVSGNGQVPACSMTGTTFGAQITSYKNIAPEHSEATMAAFVLASGPLSIGCYAQTWQSYTGGIVTNCPAQQMDHGVLIVGYDDNNSPPYWIIKNSWGPTWGESGYIRVQKGTGQCSIGQYQTTSIVASAGPTPAPAGPTSGPSGNDFTQLTCTDRSCQKCSSISKPQNTCIKGASGSYKVQCASDALVVWAFASGDCSGSSVVTANPINTCSIVFETAGDEHFIQNQCGAGPGPSPATTVAPAPPAPTNAPATPAPAATFTQMQCQDAACTVGCQSQTFPQNTCLQLSSGGSATATCVPGALQLTVYELSSTCTGSSQVQSQPVNTCEQDQSGSYFENICSGSSIGQLSQEAVRTVMKKLGKKQ